ncbi:MAG: Rv3654c family TadE-like protein [Propionibacteriaceae bacterium]
MRVGRRLDQRGSGTVLAAGVMIAVLAIGVGAVVYGGYVVTAHRAAQAADVVALSGAQAHAAGDDSCTAAEQAARANSVALDTCTLDGDGVDFAITVVVVRPHSQALPGLPDSIRATAVAGSIA